MPRKIAIAVVGDDRVGKTSLITTATQDRFSDRPPPVLPPTRFSVEHVLGDVSVVLHDTSSKPEDYSQTELTFRNASVVVLCFDAHRPRSVNRLGEFWLPELQSKAPGVPVLVAACKTDAGDTFELRALVDELDALIQRYDNFEVCLRCSARQLQRVQEVFLHAVNMVLYPMRPLFDKMTHRLQPLCVKALSRVFRLCDRDGDGVLDDTELNNFQMLCFRTSMDPAEMDSVKNVVRQRMSGGLSEGALNFQGFVYLHSLFITRGRLESTWAVLRTFGYTDDLRLSGDVLDHMECKVLPDSVQELSSAAISFLGDLFDEHCSRPAAVLNMVDLDRLFNTSPDPPHQGESWNRVGVAGSPGGSLTREGFITKWMYLARVNPRYALEQLLYLGFGGLDLVVKGPKDPSAPAVFDRRCRRRTGKDDVSNRNTIHCYVFGQQGVGKSALLRALAGRRHDEVNPSVLVAARVVEEGPTLRALIMSEVPEDIQKEVLSSSPTSSSSDLPSGWSLSDCDVAAFVFDVSNPPSFQWAVELMTRVTAMAGETMACRLVAAKDDLGMSQELEALCSAVCSELSIKEPCETSSATGEVDKAFQDLVRAALDPTDHIPDTPARKAHKAFRRRLLLYGGLMTSSLILCSLGYLGYRYFARDEVGHEAQQPEAHTSSGSAQGTRLGPPAGIDVRAPAGSSSHSKRHLGT